jgi:leader peptidase (prepilin peptidase)/N-methyltransferase
VGTVVGLVLVARHGARSRKVGVPFAPFLALGGLVAVLAGQQLIDLYLNQL